MSQSTSSNNEPGKFNKLLSGKVDQSIKARLPRSGGSAPPPKSSPPAVDSPKSGKKPFRFQFGPAFWTIASIISLSVNVGVLIAGLVILNMLGGVNKATLFAQDQASGILGGLYLNFVKMDQATIRANIPVDAVIPLNITVPVQTSTRIALAENVVIPNAHVRIATGGLNIDADAVVTLPAGTPLTVNLDFPLQVVNSIPIHLDVPVTIPLNQTELHDPFVGLRQVVEPFYCFLQPDTVINGVHMCSPVADIQNSPEPTVP